MISFPSLCYHKSNLSQKGYFLKSFLVLFILTFVLLIGFYMMETLVLIVLTYLGLKINVNGNTCSFLMIDLFWFLMSQFARDYFKQLWSPPDFRWKIKFLNNFSHTKGCKGWSSKKKFAVLLLQDLWKHAFMGKKTREKGKNRRKLHNYI